MKKINDLMKKIICNTTTFLLTGVIVEVATQGCFFVYYQPEVPEKLKKYSKNR